MRNLWTAGVLVVVAGCGHRAGPPAVAPGKKSAPAQTKEDQDRAWHALVDKPASRVAEAAARAEKSKDLSFIQCVQDALGVMVAEGRGGTEYYSMKYVAALTHADHAMAQCRASADERETSVHRQNVGKLFTAWQPCDQKEMNIKIALQLELAALGIEPRSADSSP